MEESTNEGLNITDFFIFSCLMIKDEKLWPQQGKMIV